MNRIPALPMLLAAYVGGAVAGAMLGGPWPLTVLLMSLGGSAVVLLGYRGAAILMVAVGAIAIAALGHYRVEVLDDRPIPPIAAMTGIREVVGVVRDTPLIEGVSQRVDLDVEEVDGTAAEGGIRGWLRADATPLRSGDRVRLTANLALPQPVERFDYAAFLRDRDIYLVATSVRHWERIGTHDLGWRADLRAMHDAVVHRIERTMPEPAASLAAGVLVGERSSLPQDLDEALRATGTTHLVVVSGQNVALLLGIAVAVLTAMVSRRIASVMGLALLPAYVVFVGVEPPVVRAAIMATAVVAAGVTGRRTPSWVYLVYAAGLMLVVDPALVRDVSFQLSASATAGIVTLAPVMRNALLARFPSLATPGRTAALTVVTTATGAAVAVAPVQIGAFGVIAPWTIVANVLVAPLYEATVAAAALAAVTGGTPASTVLGPLLAIPPKAFLATVEALATLPGTQIPVQLPVVAGVIATGALVVATATLNRWATGIAEQQAAPVLEPGAHTGIALTTGLAIVATGLWWTVLVSPSTHASVTILDVGQGMAVLVRDGGTSMLIDTGPPDGAVMQALGRAGVDRRVDAVVLTHPDRDHAGGLAELQRRLEVGTVYAETSAVTALNGPPDDSTGPGADAVTPIDIGDRLQVGRITAEVLAPPVATRDHRFAPPNEASLVILLTIGDRRVLIPGDVEAGGEEWLVRTGLDLHADVLVVPHHGSRTSSTEPFLAAVRPSVAVIPVGRNPHGHPHDEVVERYASAAIDLYRTDLHGSVTLRSDGDGLWITTTR